MSDALVIAGALLLGVGVPYLGMRMLAPSLAEAHTVPNFRGREVFAGLGIAWLLWAGAAIVGGTAGSSLRDGHTILPVLILAGPLALVAFALGLVDDAFGTSSDRGFRGHLRALRRGRLTTGGMKLFGISIASYVVAVIGGQAAGWSTSLGGQLLLALPAGAAIALSANFVNLTDLRPGRALKAYSVLALGGGASVALGLAAVGGLETIGRLVDGVAILIFLAGPVLAVWRFDLGEEGMLGDSGANAAGAVAGLLIVIGLPVWGMLVYFAVMLVLNLASERLSLSRLIDASPILKRLDMLGRLPLDTSADAAAKSSPQSESNPE